MSFVHLHNHTQYSLLDGLTKIPEMVAFACEQGSPAVAITDHGVMYGVIEFYKECKKQGIKPIIGVEVYYTVRSRHQKETEDDRKNNHLLLLAKNNTGYKNLLKMVTIAHLEGFYYKPRIDHEILEKYHEGLIAATACLGGEIPRYIVSGQEEKARKRILELNKLFGQGNFYLEIQDHPNLEHQSEVSRKLIEFSRELNIPLLATNDFHYLRKEDDEAQDILLCLQCKKKMEDEDRLNMMGNDYSMRSNKEMIEVFKDTPEAIENTLKIAKECNVEIELGNVQLPHFEVPAGFDGMSYLRHLCEEGLVKRSGKNYKEIDEEVKGRMDYELSVIEKMGWPSYFLIVADFVNWAKDNGIVVGPGRGSAAGSLVCYLTGITNLDPLKYGLIFERFLNPERISMPDIDLDFADTRRDEVIRYVESKYGKDHVSQIITFGTMAARASVRDVGRVLGAPYDYCDRIAKSIPMFFSIEQALKNVADFREIYEKEGEAKKIIDFAKKLEGVSRHSSTHACGVLITKEPLDNYAPMQYASSSDQTIISQYSLHPIEDLGLLKIDILGLKNLTVIEDTINIAEKTKGVKIDIDDIPLDDKKTYELFKDGETTGVFQFESSGMKRYLKELKPTQFEDIVAMVALYRPGPMEWIPDYLAGKHGRKNVKYIHEKLKPILDKTYGVAIYQEQVMQVARDLAGFTMGEADVLRKAVGKKIPELLAEQKEKFIEGCVKNGVSVNLAKEVFSFIEPFAGYGFCRSHAAGYALIGYQTAYLKAHFPTEFMAALLTSDQQNIDRIAIEIEECRNMDILVAPPDINESFAFFTAVKNEESNEEFIRFGLNAIKNVGEHVVEVIIAERKENGKYKDIFDFLERITDKDLNKKSLESLIKSGAFDHRGERGMLLGNLETLLAFNKEVNRARDNKQNSLFVSASGANSLERPKLDEVYSVNEQEKLAWEKELLGLYISEHPFNEYKKHLGDFVMPISQLSSHLNDNSVRVAGVIATIKKIITRNNKSMLFVKIEDSGNNVELLVFPNLLEQTADIWQEGLVVLCQGKLSDKDREIKVLTDKVVVLDLDNIEKSIDEFKKIEAETRRFNGNGTNNYQKEKETKAQGADKQKVPLGLIFEKNLDQDELSKLKKAFLANQGESKVYFKIIQGDKFNVVKTGFRVNINDNLINFIKKNFSDKIEVVDNN